MVVILYSVVWHMCNLWILLARSWSMLSFCNLLCGRQLIPAWVSTVSTLSFLCFFHSLVFFFSSIHVYLDASLCVVIYLCIYLSVYLSVYRRMYLFYMYLSLHVSVYLSIYLSIYLSTYVCMYLSLNRTMLLCW